MFNPYIKIPLLTLLMTFFSLTAQATPSSDEEDHSHEGGKTSRLAVTKPQIPSRSEEPNSPLLGTPSTDKECEDCENCERCTQCNLCQSGVPKTSEYYDSVSYKFGSFQFYVHHNKRVQMNTHTLNSKVFITVSFNDPDEIYSSFEVYQDETNDRLSTYAPMSTLCFHLGSGVGIRALTPLSTKRPFYFQTEVKDDASKDDASTTDSEGTPSSIPLLTEKKEPADQAEEEMTDLEKPINKTSTSTNEDGIIVADSLLTPAAPVLNGAPTVEEEKQPQSTQTVATEADLVLTPLETPTTEETPAVEQEAEPASTQQVAEDTQQPATTDVEQAPNPQ